MDTENSRASTYVSPKTYSGELSLNQLGDLIKEVLQSEERRPLGEKDLDNLRKIIEGAVLERNKRFVTDLANLTKAVKDSVLEANQRFTTRYLDDKLGSLFQYRVADPLEASLKILRDEVKELDAKISSLSPSAPRKVGKKAGPVSRNDNILDLAKKGTPNRQIAKKFGLSVTRIRQIILMGKRRGAI